MESDKPFQCPKCDQCFANSDRLAVHQLMHLKQPTRLQVKIPGIANQTSVTDQTPTPSSFLKTADVEGSPLFQELNPFDRDFRLASNSRQNSTVETNSENAKKKNESSTRDTENYKVEVVQESKSLKENEESIDDGGEMHRSEVDDAVSSTTPTSISTMASQQNTSDILQSLLSQIQSQKQVSAQPKQEKTEEERDEDEGKTTLNGNQDALREQLKSLLNSGLIKIQITPYPASTKVQATIVGNVATAKTTLRPVATTVTPGMVPRIAPKVSSITTTTKMESAAVLTVHSSAGVTQTIPSVLPGTNLQIAKQKLKQVIQSTEQPDQINRISMATTPSSSSQGKYKDIILEDELGDIELGKRRGRTPGEDYSPEEKRRRFLERNRAAASRCRQKRKIWVDQLEKKSDNLVSTNQHLMTEISSLRNEVAQLKALLLAHKECPVTLQQKALVNQITSGIGTYVAVSDGQLITLQQFPPNSIRKASDEEVASSALTDMAARATIELGKKASSGVVTVQASSLLPR